MAHVETWLPATQPARLCSRGIVKKMVTSSYWQLLRLRVSMCQECSQGNHPAS